ncbi:serine hydrolase domain-containing protein [Paraurantiacibacter namhicola]
MLAGCATPAPAPAPAETPSQSARFQSDCAAISSFLDNAVAQGCTVGASMLVWKDGQEVCFTAAGFAVREREQPFARDTLVQIFSMTKPVTGVALMQLWEQGKFGLDDPLYWHLPEYEGLQVVTGVDEDGQPILRPPSRPPTIRDAMRHTAGFTYVEAGGPAYEVWKQLDPLAFSNTLEEFSLKLAQVPLIADPGTRWSYSAGVDVQARLVEVLSGMPFADYVQQNIFTPLGMQDSGWQRDPADLPRLAQIYVQKGDAFEPDDPKLWLEANFAGARLTMGGSGIVTTVDDYMRFARMLLREGELEGVRILQPGTIRVMATDMLDPRIPADQRGFLPGKGTGGFGINFLVRTAPPQTAGENRGTVGEFFWDGYPSMLFWVDPAQDMAVIFATQKIPFDNALHHDVRDAVYGPDYAGTVPD